MIYQRVEVSEGAMTGMAGPPNLTAETGRTYGGAKWSMDARHERKANGQPLPVGSRGGRDKGGRPPLNDYKGRPPSVSSDDTDWGAAKVGHKRSKCPSW